MSAIFNFIWALSGILYGYVTTISFLTSPAYYKLKNAPLADKNRVHTINSDIHLLYEVPAAVNVYRAGSSLSDTDSYFFQTILCRVY